MAGQRGFWDIEERLAALTAEGDPLEKLSATVNFELFRPLLLQALRRSAPVRTGRPPFLPGAEVQDAGPAIVARSVAGTDGLYGARSPVADGFCAPALATAFRTPIRSRDFREALIKAKALDKLFARLNDAIAKAGYLPMGAADECLRIRSELLTPA